MSIKVVFPSPEAPCINIFSPNLTFRFKLLIIKELFGYLKLILFKIKFFLTIIFDFSDISFDNVFVSL